MRPSRELDVADFPHPIVDFRKCAKANPRDGRQVIDDSIECLATATTRKYVCEIPHTQVISSSLAVTKSHDYDGKDGYECDGKCGEREYHSWCERVVGGGGKFGKLKTNASPQDIRGKELARYDQDLSEHILTADGAVQNEECRDYRGLEKAIDNY